MRIKQLSHDTLKFKKAVKRFLLANHFTHWKSIIIGMKMLLVDIQEILKNPSRGLLIE
jgi:hypothetical protein